MSSKAPEGAVAGRHVILCGGGNNGGDGFVIARHLANHAVDVEILLASDPARLPGAAMVNYEIARRMGLPMHSLLTEVERAANLGRLTRAAVVVDALLGTGFSGDVRAPLAEIIHAINRLTAARVVAVDVPSGLDCDTGLPSAATVKAHVTVTFVAPKVGFANATAQAYLGAVHVVDIGAPASIVPLR